MKNFFINRTATTEIYTLSLHDALPISVSETRVAARRLDSLPRLRSVHRRLGNTRCAEERPASSRRRSEEHTSELQSQSNLVCRLLLEKKNEKIYYCFDKHN